MPGRPVYYFERPSQPLTILLRAPSRTARSPIFFSNSHARNPGCSPSGRVPPAAQESTCYACATDGRSESRRARAKATPRLARSAGVFGLATITSRILGLVRDQVLAYYFGAGDANDAFRVASRIPNLVRDLFAEGAMSAAFVPTFTRQLTLARPRARRGGSPARSSTPCSSSPARSSLLGIVFAEPLVRLFASEFSEVPGKIELTIYLTRIVFPFLTLVAVAAVLMGMLNSLGHFFMPALSPAMFNVAVIVIVADADSVRADRSAFSRSRSSRSRRWSAVSGSWRSSGRRSARKAFVISPCSI